MWQQIPALVENEEKGTHEQPKCNMMNQLKM